MASLAYDEAVAHYERAISTLAFEPSSERWRLELKMKLADAAWRAGDNLKSRSTLEWAARAARALGDAGTEAIAAAGYIQALGPIDGGDPKGIELLEGALGALGGGDSPRKVAVLVSLAVALSFASEHDRRTDLVSTALEMARRLEDPDALAMALYSQHDLLLGPGDPHQRLVLADEVIARAKRLDQSNFPFVMHLRRINDLLEVGDGMAADLEVAALARSANATGSPNQRWHAMQTQACIALLRGRFDEGRRLAAEALAARRDGQDRLALQLFALQDFVRRRDTGGAAGCEASISAFVREFPANDGWRASLVALLAETGREDAARAALDQMFARDLEHVRRDANYLAVLALVSESVSLLRDEKRAAVLYPLLLPFAQRNVVVHVEPVVCLGSVSRYLGLVAATRCELVAATRHYEDALAMNARLGARPQVAHSQTDYARMLIERREPGDAERARGLLAGATATADELGMYPLLERLAELRERVGALLQKTGDKPAIDGTFRNEGAFWNVKHGGQTMRLKDTKGLRFLALLLGNPAREFHVLDLAGRANDASSEARAQTSQPCPQRDTAGRASRGGSDVLLDSSARAAYKQRLEDLRDELEEARRFNDPGRAAHAQREIELLTSELSRKAGIEDHGNSAAQAERARQNVSRSISAVVRSIASQNPDLGQHLAATVRTGMFCSYNPDPRVPVSWTF
jgi:hypothetical protein